MKIGITPLIAENIAPSNVSKLAIFKGNTKICDVDISKMRPSNLGNKLYSFGLVSDIHIYTDAMKGWYTDPWYPNEKFDNALEYFQNNGCDFCVVCGDLTQTGMFNDVTKEKDTGQFENYKTICDKHPNITVYEICGNHESYTNPITDTLADLKEYVGSDQIYYKVEHKGDIFIFCGQSEEAIPMSDDAFKFLKDTLSDPDNKDKRCFVFVHPVWNDDSGDAAGAYSNHSGLGGTLLSSWNKGEELKNLLKNHQNHVVLFHGHTHIKFEEQVKDKNLNYTYKNYFHSVHIPSLGRPRDITSEGLVYSTLDSQGYIVDVYDDCIVLNGFNYPHEIVNGEAVKKTVSPVPFGTFKIDI